MGASQQLTINIDVSSGLVTGQWVYGDIRLSATGRPDAVLTAAVFASGGDLPPEWVIDADTDAGAEDFILAQLSAMPDATFQRRRAHSPRSHHPGAGAGPDP